VVQESMLLHMVLVVHQLFVVDNLILCCIQFLVIQYDTLFLSIVKNDTIFCVNPLVWYVNRTGVLWCKFAQMIAWKCSCMT
jgi:hypothetical protein